MSGHLDIPAARIAEVLAALPEHTALTRAEPGCIRFAVNQNPDDPQRLDVSETFVDQAAFEFHQARAGSSEWARITAGLPRHYTMRTERGD